MAPLVHPKDAISAKPRHFPRRVADAERARTQEAARAQGRPGGQLSPAEAFPPDPREGPEVVTLGRVAGGRGIRRVN